VSTSCPSDYSNAHDTQAAASDAVAFRIIERFRRWVVSQRRFAQIVMGIRLLLGQPYSTKSRPSARLLPSHGRQEIFHAQEVSRFVASRSPGCQIQFADRAIGRIAGIVHNDIHFTHIPALSGYRLPILSHVTSSWNAHAFGPILFAVSFGSGDRSQSPVLFALPMPRYNRLPDTFAGAGLQRHLAIVIGVLINGPFC
jgi:hypothetical protein